MRRSTSGDLPTFGLNLEARLRFIKRVLGGYDPVMKVNQFERAARMWDVLAHLAAEKKRDTYEALATKLGLHHRVLRYPLDLIFQYCLEERFPPLTVLIINKLSGLPGAGYATASSIEADTKQVLAFPWTEVANPFAFAAAGATYDEQVKKVLSGPHAALEVQALVKTRGIMQQIFRDALLNAYRGRCAFSGSSLVETLEAAHIVPWAAASDEERCDVRNGLLLNTYFHRLFDRGLLLLYPDYRIQPGPELRVDELSLFDQQAINPVLGQRIQLPRHKDFFPDKAYLSRRMAG